MIRTVVFIIMLSLSSCTYERIYIGDVEQLLNTQLINNEAQIEVLKSDLNRYKISKIQKNVTFIENIERIHQELLSVSDSMESMTQAEAAASAARFIDRYFGAVRFYHKHLEITETTPKTVLKLHLAVMEGFFLKEQEGRYTYDDDVVSFSTLMPIIVPDKFVYQRNELITGRVILTATTDDPEMLLRNWKLIQKIEVNGMEIRSVDGLGRFALKSGQSIGELSLATKLTLRDSSLITQTSVYVKE